MVEDYRKRRKSPSKKKKVSRINRVLGITKRMVLGISLGMIVLCGVFYVSNSNIFLVSRIDIQGNYQVSQDDCLVLLDLEKGDHILSWNIRKARNRLMENPWIKEANISRRLLPASVRISIQEYIPELTLILEDKQYLVTAKGKILARSKGGTTGLVIRVRDGYRDNDALEEIIKKEIRAADMIRKKGLGIEEMAILAGGRMEIMLDNGVHLAFLEDMTSEKIEMALMAMEKINPEPGCIMDLFCEDRIILRNRRTYGSKG
ncbi:MAG: FtsQ-type POTRA domain-containing protein [Thermodesulfobacteriota bacterium]|nr:FtsQ-type POTRA domain-containing protein [Thermodesulfobacteriota bacterium]